jgi:hypothetical protein
VLELLLALSQAAHMAIADLLVLQGKCKTDPESYRDEFALRLRHYQALRVGQAATVSKFTHAPTTETPHCDATARLC